MTVPTKGQRSRSVLVYGFLVTAVVALASCGQRPAAAGALADSTAAQPDVSPSMELGAKAQLDSGNTAYRARDYSRALTHYRTAAARQPSLAAAWMGISMAQTALGNAAAADSAMKKVEQLAPGTTSAHPPAGGSATTVTGSAGVDLPAGHPGAGSTAPGGALPARHPPLAPSGR